MMDFKWKFGQDRIAISVPDSDVKAILKRKGFESVDGFVTTVESALENPIGTPKLREIKKKGPFGINRSERYHQADSL